MGLIDPSYFYDTAKNVHYLLWKLDGNSLTPRAPCIIYAQPLASNGLAVTGTKSELIRNDQVRLNRTLAAQNYVVLNNALS